MRRHSHSATATLLVTGVVLFATMAASRSAENTLQPVGPAPTVAANTDLSLPGFWELRTDDVQRELDLTAEQRQRLQAIGRKYFEQLEQTWAAPREASAGADAQPYPQDHPKQMEELRQQVQAVFSPDQLERLKLISLRTRGVAALADPRVIDQLGINEVQQKRLRQLREQMQDAIRRIQQETLGKTLEELTPAQRTGLEMLTTEGAAAPSPAEPVVP